MATIKRNEKIPTGWVFLDWKQNEKIWKDCVPMDALINYFSHDLRIEIVKVQMDTETFEQYLELREAD